MDIEALMTDNVLADEPEHVDDVRRRLFGSPPPRRAVAAPPRASADPVCRGLIGTSVAIGVATALTALLCTDTEPLQWRDDLSPQQHRVLQSVPELHDRHQAHVESWREAADQIDQSWRPWDARDVQRACLRAINDVVSEELIWLTSLVESEPSAAPPRSWTPRLFDPWECTRSAPPLPRHDRLHALWKARSLSRGGHHERALVILEDLRARTPRSLDLLSGLIDYQRGGALLGMGRPEAWDVLGDAQVSHGGEPDFFVEATLLRAEAGPAAGRSSVEVSSMLAGLEDVTSPDPSIHTDDPSIE